MLAQGKPLNRNKFSLMSSRSALVDGNLSKSPNFVVKACVTRRTTRLTVDSSNPRKLSLITCRNEPEARNIRVMKRTCIIVETAWFLSFVVFFSSATRLTMYFTGSRPKRYMYLNSELAQDSLGFSWQRKILFFIRR